MLMGDVIDISIQNGKTFMNRADNEMTNAEA
jgi:hypothetical protein